MRVLSFDTSHIRRTVINLTWEKQVLTLSFDIDSSQQDKLLFGIDHLLSTIGGKIQELDAIVVGRGPGSFTGLRIGLSLAKGFAWANRIPLHPVSSLEVLALSFPWQCQPEATVVAMTDARMKKIYATIYQKRQKILAESDVSAEELSFHLKKLPPPYWFVGDTLYQDIFVRHLGERNCYFLSLWIDPLVLRERGLSTLALSHEELRSLQPLYLRASEAENQKYQR